MAFRALTALLLLAAGPAGARVCEGCNVLLVSIDTLRADAVGALGSQRASTPRIDAWAARGRLFASAFSQAPNTFPSHMSMFTGLQPWRHGVNVAFRDRLRPGVETVAERLRKRGYETRWFGPLRDPYLDLKAGFARGFDDLQQSDPGVFGAAEAWLSSRPAGPFFAFVHTYRVHDPYFPRPESLERVGGAPPGSRIPPAAEFEDGLRREILARPSLVFRPEALDAYADVFADPALAWSRIRPLLDVPGNLHTPFFSFRSTRYWELVDLSSAPDVAEQRLRYDALVSEADEGFGRLMEALERSGQAERTLVILTSDHGEEFMEHGRTRHNQLYAESLRVPLLVLAPGAAPGVSTSVVQSVDILPTILDFLGAPPEPGLDGVSLAVPRPARPAFAFFRGRIAIRDERWTYVAKPGPGGEIETEALYDRALDPGEKTELLGSGGAEALEAAARLRALIPRPLPDREGRWPDGVDEKARRRLLETGYW